MIHSVRNSNLIYADPIVEAPVQDKWKDLTKAYKKASANASQWRSKVILSVVAAIALLAAGALLFAAAYCLACPPLLFGFVFLEGAAGLLGLGIKRAQEEYSEAKAVKKMIESLVEVKKIYESGKSEEAKKVFDRLTPVFYPSMSSLPKLFYQNCGWDANQRLSLN